ncbi:MAG: ATP-dependent metallopeptidase FtsH/Yme1/Tma family protein, partial [Solirubrobacteraceae bacterium]
MTAVFVALVLALTLLNVLAAIGPPRMVIPYSQFLTLVDQGRVKTADVSASDVTGVYQASAGEQPFVTTRPPQADDTTLVPLLEQKGVQFTGSQPSPLSGFVTNFLLGWLLPFVLLAG